MNGQTPHQVAHQAATHFVLSRGEELPGGEHCEALTLMFVAILLDFEKRFSVRWRTKSSSERFRIAATVADSLLTHELATLNRRLTSVDRFDWRIALSQLLLNYMQDRVGYDNSLGSLLDYYQLVNQGIRTCHPN